jgi:hypothetical protein
MGMERTLQDWPEPKAQISRQEELQAEFNS